jgi:ABC-type uncharacterized transport system fused permease/ATPase subunit
MGAGAMVVHHDSIIHSSGQYILVAVQSTTISHKNTVMLSMDAGEHEPSSRSYGSNDEQQLADQTYGRNTMGVAYQNLNVYGFGSQTDYQKTFANYPLMYFSRFRSFLTGKPKERIDILRDFEGLVSNGEMLLVLGRPGSGCSTLLKTLAGQSDGFHVDPQSRLNYHGKTA